MADAKTATMATDDNEGVRALLRYCRLSPYKVRQVLDLIRGQHVERARDILRFSDRGASVVVLKLLNSAIANAGNNNDIPEDELFVSACFADEGPTMRRFRPRARGRATRHGDRQPLARGSARPSSPAPSCGGHRSPRPPSCRQRSRTPPRPR
jgi:large subunit ribosomal protein L22